MNTENMLNVDNQSDMSLKQKMYSVGAVSWASIFGGPIAASFLIRRNFLVMNKRVYAAKSLLWAFSFQFALIFLLFFIIPISISDKIPSFFYNAIWLVVVNLILAKVQGEKLKYHKENKGLFYSKWKAVLIGILCSGFVLVPATCFSVFAATKMHKIFKTNEEREIKALTIMHNAQYLNDHKAISEKVLPLFKKNKDEIIQIQESFLLGNMYGKDLDEVLEVYSLRIEQNELLVKKSKEHTNMYDDKLSKINKKIDKIIKNKNIKK